ncbi:ribonuclease H-like domain-containing protein [Tanacetum coccineum]
MRTKPGIDTLSFDDLYNNLRVFESDVKGSTASSSGTQNVAFVSENTSSTNEVSTAYGASSSSGHKPQREGSSSYADDLIFSFFANQSSGPQLDHEDLEQIDEFDLEEMDLKWQVAMISMRIKKFYKKTGRRLHFDAKEPVGFDKSKLECYNCHKKGHFAKECRSKGNQESRRRDAWNSGYKAKDNGTRPGKQEETKALVTLDGDGVDWTSHSEDEQDNHAFMAYSSSGSDTEVTSCSKECKESYAKIKKLYDEQREQLSDASIEIKAYTQALKKVEAQLVAHQQNQLWYEEKIRFMKIDLDDKTDVLTYHKKLLAEAEKEKEELKAKVEKWHNSSKNLNILLKSQMSARDKAGLGSSDTENSHVNTRYAEGMHAVPPPMTGIYIPSGPAKEIDDSQFTYGPKQSKPSESDARSSDFTSCESNSSKETHESMPETIVNEPTVVIQPNVWTDAPIIEEYESDSEDEHVSLPSKEQETPSFANTIKHVKTPRQTVKQQNTCSKNCDFHKKRMAKQAKLNKRMCKATGQRENRSVWNNVQRVNHKNQFLPAAVLTRTGRIQVNTARTSCTNTVNTARHNFNSHAVPTNAGKKVNTVKPIVNNARPKTGFHKTLSPIKRPFNRTTSPRTNFLKQKVYTAEVKAVSAVGGKRETVVKPSAGCNWRPKRHYWNKVSKYNGGSNTRNYDYPQRALQNKGIVDSGCSRHMTRNKAYFAEYQDFNGGPVAFGGSKGYITGKVSTRGNIGPLGGLACLIAKATVENLTKMAYEGLGNSEMEAESAQDYFVLPIWSSYTSIVKSSEAKTEEKEAHDAAEALRKEFTQDTKDLLLQAGAAKASSTNIVNTASTPVSTVSPSGGLSFTDLTNTDQDDSEIPALEDSYDNPNDGIFTNASYDDEDPKSAVQTRNKVNKSSGAHAFVSYIQKQRRNNHKDFQHCLFACFLSQNEPKKISEALKDESWVDAMQEELLQFKIQKVWILVDLPYGKKAIGTKWVYRNKKDERRVVVRNKARLVAHGHRQEERIDYDETDVKSAFLYGIIDEEVYVSTSRNPKEFDFASVKTASTPIETQKPLVKDEEASDVDVHLYRSMIGSLMYLTASRPNIMFPVCACSRFQVTPKTSHLNGVKRIFRYLKGKPKLDLWYPRVSSFDLEAYSDSDYAGANLDRKSTTGGCQFLSRRLISWQCKKQTIVATSTTEAEYVVAANCCGQVLWIQNQMLDYGFNFNNTKIYIDNESTICIVKNPVFHSKTKHITIRHHFIRDAYEKKLIQAALVKGRQDDLLYSFYGMLCEQKNLDNGDVFPRVIWVLESK